ncbi:hypothetical protein FKM82_015094 [Ascaphus truei]
MFIWIRCYSCCSVVLFMYFHFLWTRGAQLQSLRPPPPPQQVRFSGYPSFGTGGPISLIEPPVLKQGYPQNLTCLGGGT